LLPAEQNKGAIWRDGRLLCDVEYSISELLQLTDGNPIQRVTLTLSEEDCASLLDAYDLTLVLANGTRRAIPRPLRSSDKEYLECYLEVWRSRLVSSLWSGHGMLAAIVPHNQSPAP
jgi:hypothetical protein